LLSDSVARFWRLEHAVRHNGHAEFRKAALEAQQWLALWIEGDPSVQGLAEQLLTLLERTVRTSSAAEAINSVLRPYLVRRRECTDLINRQLFLNLFVLWFNLHKFERGARKGKSPYEIAGIDLGTGRLAHSVRVSARRVLSLANLTSCTDWSPLPPPGRYCFIITGQHFFAKFVKLLCPLFRSLNRALFFEGFCACPASNSQYE